MLRLAAEVGAASVNREKGGVVDEYSVFIYPAYSERQNCFGAPKVVAA